MPVIVVGADTDVGETILEALHQPGREIRVFVSDPGRVDDYRSQGYKVALGDVSDDSHVEGASTRCFSAVLIGEAARDERERSFAETETAVLQGWANAVQNSDVRRVIWVGVTEPPQTDTPETALVDDGDDQVGPKVAALDDAHSIT